MRGPGNTLPCSFIGVPQGSCAVTHNFQLFCTVGNFSAEDILLTGGTVTEVIPVPDTFEYFVWVAVTPGVASLRIAVNPGMPLLRQLL